MIKHPYHTKPSTSYAMTVNNNSTDTKLRVDWGNTKTTYGHWTTQPADIAAGASGSFATSSDAGHGCGGIVTFKIDKQSDSGAYLQLKFRVPCDGGAGITYFLQCNKDSYTIYPATSEKDGSHDDDIAEHIDFSGNSPT